MTTTIKNVHTKSEPLYVRLVYPTKNGGKIHIEIRCSDPCNNGHNDFAITATVYDKKGLDVMGGCCHEEILHAVPNLKPFVDLHLSDENGTPMYAIENGFYHLQGVLGVADYNHTMTVKGFSEYLRIDLKKAQTLVKTFEKLLKNKGVSVEKLKTSIQQEKDNYWAYQNIARELKRTSLNKSEVKRFEKLEKEAEHKLNLLEEEIKEYRNTGKKEFSDFIDSLRPVWKKEADKAKALLKQLIKEQE